MRLIDLLVKIANKEEVPKKIKYEGDIYTHTESGAYYCTKSFSELNDRIFAEYSSLNDEIEILDKIENNPEKIEEIEVCGIDPYDKLNEVIKAVNYLLEKSNKNE